MNNKNCRRALVASLIALALALEPAFAAPQKILYQGTLRRSGAIFSGDAAFLFRITDEAGSAQYWTSGSTVVAVTGGLFRYPLGVTSAGLDGGFPAIDWANITPYVEVTIDGTLLLPREPLASVPYALSGSVANVAAANVLAGALGPAVIASSIAVNAINSAGQLAPSLVIPDSNLPASMGAKTFTGALTANAGVLATTVTLTNVTADPAGAIGMLAFRSDTNKLRLNIAGTGWVDVSTGTSAGGGGSFVSKAGDTMAGQLTLAGSTLTVQGNAFSVGGSTLVVSGGNVGVGTAGPLHKLDVNGALYSRTYALTDSAAITVDWNSGNVQSVTLGGNRTLAFTGGQNGGKYMLILKQDATGGRSVTWPGGVLWPGGTVPTQTTAANKTDVVGFIYNGANYLGIGSALNF